MNDVYFGSVLSICIYRFRRALFFGCVCAAILLWPAASTNAAIISLGLSTEFSGGTPPEGAAPWLTATFDDEVVGGNTVRLTMSASGLVDAENVGEWSFNLDPSLDPTLLNFAVVGVPGSTPNAISTGVNAFQADGDGKFDILFDFPPPPGSAAALFTAGETVVYDITYDVPATLTANSFLYPSVEGGGQGTFRTAAHVQRIGPENDDSGWIGDIPEPASFLLLGIGLFGICGIRLRRG
jgi:hypothetical protein